MNIKLQKGDLVVWDHKLYNLILNDNNGYFLTLDVFYNTMWFSERRKLDKSVFKYITIYRKDKQIFPKMDTK